MLSMPDMVPSLWQEFVAGRYPAVAAAAVTALVLAIIIKIVVTLGPAYDPREPPLVKPKIPVIGHFIGLGLHRVHYFSMVYNENKVPVATLPMVENNMYVIFSAHMQQIAMRSNSMAANAKTVELIPRLFGVKKATLLSWLGRDGVHEDMTPSMMKIFGTTLSGDSLNDMTYTALVEVGAVLNGIKGDGLHIENLYLWLRYHISHAVSVALFGTEHNPYYHSQEIIDAQWDFEAGLGPLVLGFLPSIIARSAYLARAKVHKALRPYYEKDHDQDEHVSNLVRERGQLFRKWDTSVDQLSKNEISMMLAATTNTVPTMFWYMAHVWTRPELVEKLRTEVSQFVPCLHDSNGIRRSPPVGLKEITINFSKLDTNCLLLGSCYREAVRLSSHIITLRRVATDMVISDSDGKSYLLKAGNDVMIPAKVVHRNPETWGENVDGFNPCRFLPDPDGNKERDKLRKMSFVPFGGGKHYCPGRHFAFNENLAIMATTLLGFELEGLDKNKLRMEDSKMGQAAKPLPGFEGGPCVIKRRKGWENIEWKFAK